MNEMNNTINNKNNQLESTLYKKTNRLSNFLPEVVITSLLVLIFGISVALSPFFLDFAFIIKQLLLYLELGILAIALTPVIVSGNLDLSVASSMVLVSGLVAYVHAHLGVPMALALPFGIVLGALAGGLNGFMIAYIGLPWVTVTLGTMALYRGIAQILLGVHSIQEFPAWFVGINKIYIPGTIIPVSFLIFAVLALIFALMLHKTVLGRWFFAVGTNENAAHFAGVPVKRVKLLVFVFSGVMSAIAGLMMVSRLAVARYDLAQGFELNAITAVVLGGTSIYGGRGTVFGTVIAVLVVGFLRTGMGVANVKAESQLAVVGALLVIAVILSNLLKKIGKGNK